MASKILFLSETWDRICWDGAFKRSRVKFDMYIKIRALNKGARTEIASDLWGMGPL